MESVSSSQRFVGTSSETKPTANVQAFSEFLENDTGSIYLYDGNSWVQKSTSGAAHNHITANDVQFPASWYLEWAGTAGAAAAGMKCVGFLNPNSGGQDLSSADLLVTDFGSENRNRILELVAE